MEGMLRRLARRCEIHDRAAILIICGLEGDLDMERSPAAGDFVDQHTNPRLIDCGHTWCRAHN